MSQSLTASCTSSGWSKWYRLLTCPKLWAGQSSLSWMGCVLPFPLQGRTSPNVFKSIVFWILGWFAIFLSPWHRVRGQPDMRQGILGINMRVRDKGGSPYSQGLLSTNLNSTWQLTNTTFSLFTSEESHDTQDTQAKSKTQRPRKLFWWWQATGLLEAGSHHSHHTPSSDFCVSLLCLWLDSLWDCLQLPPLM